MNFEINGVLHFLAFDKNEDQWYLFRPSDNGIDAVKVHDDDMFLTPPVLGFPNKSSVPRVD